MDKQFIIGELQRVAKESGGRTPGRAAFQKATGIRDSDWLGKHWVRWSDAISEAGLQPNKMRASLDTEFVAEQFISLIRELGRFPTVAELKFKARNDESFPSHNVFTKHLGGKSARASFIKSYCEAKGGMDDVVQICRPQIATHEKSKTPIQSDNIRLGYVYLLKSGKYYKIGSTNNPDRRQYEIGLHLPEKIDHIHSIETDDPSGIEAYWHNRFREKRMKGEWFKLEPLDVQVFKKRKFM